jgi:hypothetical protein
MVFLVIVSERELWLNTLHSPHLRIIANLLSKVNICAKKSLHYFSITITKAGDLLMKKRITAMILTVAMVFAMIPIVETPTEARSRVGDKIRFGGHVWRVLEVRDGKALVISDMVLGLMGFEENSWTRTTWEKSSVRAYLNGEFLNQFNATDRERIVPTTISTPDNPWYGSPGGADTTDHFFLLSIEEVVRYFGDSGQLSNRGNTHFEGGADVRISDRYNDARIAYTREWLETILCTCCYKMEIGHIEPRWMWWLRSQGEGGEMSNSVAFVDTNGRIYIRGTFHGGSEFPTSDGGIANSFGIRPAMWLTELPPPEPLRPYFLVIAV